MIAYLDLSKCLEESESCAGFKRDLAQCTTERIFYFQCSNVKMNVCKPLFETFSLQMVVETNDMPIHVLWVLPVVERDFRYLASVPILEERINRDVDGGRCRDSISFLVIVLFDMLDTLRF